MKLKFLILFLIAIFLLVSCKKRNNNDFLVSSEPYLDCAKILTGYYFDNPVFDILSKNQLILQKNDSIFSFLKYEPQLKPKFVIDSFIIFVDSNKIVFNHLKKRIGVFKTNSEIINIAYNKSDSSIYFSNNFNKEIKKININKGKIEKVSTQGYFLTVNSNELYYYTYTNEADVSPIVDLYRTRIKNNISPEKIASQISEEFIVISTNGKYVLSTDCSNSNYKDVIYCINQKSRLNVEEEIPANYNFAYFSPQINKFIYYQTYTLEKIIIP